jgi:predicted P-loop ATPase/GTPase
MKKSFNKKYVILKLKDKTNKSIHLDENISQKNKKNKKSIKRKKSIKNYKIMDDFEKLGFDVDLYKNINLEPKTKIINYNNNNDNIKQPFTNMLKNIKGIIGYPSIKPKLKVNNEGWMTSSNKNVC